MADVFNFDVFLSHSSKDKALVRPLTERLRVDGLRVWLDEWQIKPGDSILAKIEEGLEQSRLLVFCMSATLFMAGVGAQSRMWRCWLVSAKAGDARQVAAR